MYKRIGAMLKSQLKSQTDNQHTSSFIKVLRKSLFLIFFFFCLMWEKNLKFNNLFDFIAGVLYCK